MFEPLYQYKRQSQGTTPNIGGYQGGRPPIVGNKDESFVLPKQIMCCVVDGMLEVGLVTPSQIMFLSRT